MQPNDSHRYQMMNFKLGCNLTGPLYVITKSVRLQKLMHVLVYYAVKSFTISRCITLAIKTFNNGILERYLIFT